MTAKVCTIDNCDGATIAMGLCWKHYKRVKRHGNADTTLRRHKLPHECRHCGTNDPAVFYPGYRGICKECQKVQSVRRTRNGLPTTPLGKLVTSLVCRDRA